MRKFVEGTTTEYEEDAEGNTTFIFKTDEGKEFKVTPVEEAVKPTLVCEYDGNTVVKTFDTSEQMIQFLKGLSHSGHA